MGPVCYMNLIANSIIYTATQPEATTTIFDEIWKRNYCIAMACFPCAYAISLVVSHLGTKWKILLGLDTYPVSKKPLT